MSETAIKIILILKERLKLKIRGGQAHNWLGNIRERIFCVREKDAPVLRKKNRKSVRSVSRAFEEDETDFLLGSQKRAHIRISRSANDLHQLLSMEDDYSSAEDNEDSDDFYDLQSVTSSLRSRATSISASSINSGSSSVSSRGSVSQFKRRARIPVTGFTGRAFLANER